MGGPSAPKADPRIGRAAMKSAKIGEDHLDFMRGQAKITNRWAEQDRKRYRSRFQPLENDYIRDANQYDTPGRRRSAARAAVADVRQEAAVARGVGERALAARGVDPRSSAYREGMRKSNLTGALAAAGAATGARRQVEATGDGMRVNAINMGKGLAVNPGTSMGLTNSAANAGATGAMRGVGQQGNMLNQDFQNRMSVYQAGQSSTSALLGAAGTVAGYAIMSDEKKKEGRRPASPGALDAVERMPVEEWRYKRGVADEGEHVGTMAQDFKRETGRGDGETIPVGDAIGVTMQAVQELSEKVDRLAGGRGVRRAAA